MSEKRKTYYLINQSCGPLFIDIVNEFISQDCKTILITGQINSIHNDLKEDVKIINSFRYNRISHLKRIFSWVLFSLHIFTYVFLSSKTSVWLISTNPPFVPWLIPLIKIRGAKTVLLVYDIYPELLKSGKILSEKNVLYRIWCSITQSTYKHCDNIITLGKTMTEYITNGNNHFYEKITTIPNWNVIRFNDVLKKQGSTFKKIRNAENKIHILYSGNLGASHNFSTILEVAKKFRNNHNFVFTIIGEGFQKNKVIQFIQDNNLNNIKHYDFQHADQVADVFISGDIALITLGEGAEKASIPSKTYDALAAGSALLVIAPKGSELESLVKEAKCGECFEPGDIEGVCKYFKDLNENRSLLESYKKASKLKSLQFTPENAKKYFDLLSSL